MSASAAVAERGTSGVGEPLIPKTDGTASRYHGLLSTRGVRVTFKDLEYKLPSNVERGKTATVLHRMTGFLNPGEMTAIMGPSGCGKTILMNVLSGRTTKGTVTGDIRYAGTQPTEMFLRRVTGYVAQFGTLIENLTTYEMLMYTAELKTPISISFDQKKHAVNDLITRLALDICRDTKIGNPQLDRGISGGEAKRVNIAVALISNPRVLYMDEPISGLDSYTANEVMSIVKDLVTDGITLCASLHSPTPYVFNLFDSLLLLLRGNVVYFGARLSAIKFFEKTATIDDIHATTDSEWITDVIVKVDAADRVDELIEAYRESTLKRDAAAAIDMETEELHIPPEITKELNINQATIAPAWFGIKTLLKVVNNDLFIYLCYGLGRGLFYREVRDGLYRVSTFYLVTLFEEAIVILVAGVIFSLIVLSTVDLGGSYLTLYLIYIGNYICSLGIAFLVSYTCPTIDAAMAAVACYYMTLGMYCGFYIREKDIPKAVRWYTNVNFIRFGFGATLINRYQGSEEGRNFRIPMGGNSSIPVLEFYGYDGIDALEFVGYMYLFAIGYLFLAYLGMHFLRRER